MLVVILISIPFLFIPLEKSELILARNTTIFNEHLLDIHLY